MKKNRRYKKGRKIFTSEKKSVGTNNMHARPPGMVVDYGLLLTKILNKPDFSIEQVEKIQDMALNGALTAFNKEPLLVECDAVIEQSGSGFELRYFTDYNPIKFALMDKLRDFDLYFAFTKVNDFIEPKTKLRCIQVDMDVCHKLGGKLSLQSKPVPVLATTIDNISLTIDKCISSATTKAKKDVLISSVFNLIVDASDCYKGDLIAPAQDGMLPIDEIQKNELNTFVDRSKNPMVLLKSLREVFGYTGINNVQRYKFNDVKMFLISAVGEDTGVKNESTEDEVVIDKFISSKQEMNILDLTMKKGIVIPFLNAIKKKYDVLGYSELLEKDYEDVLALLNDFKK